MKVRFILVTLLLCLLLSACGENATVTNTAASKQQETEPGADISVADMDAQNKYALFSAISFQETDNYFCGGSMNNDLLYFYDKQTGLSGVLCADPSCTHDGSTCGAYAKNGATMFLYKDQRFWITNDVSADGNDYVLWHGDIGGSNQRKIKTISFENIVLTYQPQQFAIHRGNLYFLGTADTISGTNTGVRVTLMGSPLDGSEAFTTLFDQTYNANVNAQVRYIGDYAFFLVQSWAEAGFVDLSVYKINLNNGETETVYEELGGSPCDGFWVTEQEAIYLVQEFALRKLEDETLASVATFHHTEDVVRLMDGIAVSTYLENNKRCIEIMDFSGKILYDGNMFIADIPGMLGDPNSIMIYGMLIVGGDSDKLIVGLNNLMNGSKEFYVILLDLHNNLEPTLLWRAQ